MSDILAYIGTYTREGGKGIYIHRYDADTGALTPVGSVESENPSFLAIHPSGRFLYAVNEVGEYKGEQAGAISAFAIGADATELTLINQQSTKGTGPCHVSIDATGRYAVVANYGGGSTCLLPIADTGALGEASDFVQHEGNSVNPQRQQGPHAHSANISPDNKYVYVADLGLDKVLIYQLDLDQGKLIANDPPSVSVAPGQGPRHFAFHPDGQCAYLINEIGNTVAVYAHDAGTGTLTPRQSISTLPDEFSGTSHTADIHVSSDFVYGSNRGHDSVAIFAIDKSTGTLTLVDIHPTGGQTPRNIALSPDGNHLIAENQASGTIVSFAIDHQTGKLTATGHAVDVPMPVCLKFLQRCGDSRLKHGS